MSLTKTEISLHTPFGIHILTYIARQTVLTQCFSSTRAFLGLFSTNFHGTRTDIEQTGPPGMSDVEAFPSIPLRSRSAIIYIYHLSITFE
jgi:hypothetical protein